MHLSRDSYRDHGDTCTDPRKVGKDRSEICKDGAGMQCWDAMLSERAIAKQDDDDEILHMSKPAVEAVMRAMIPVIRALAVATLPSFDLELAPDPVPVALGPPPLVPGTVALVEDPFPLEPEDEVPEAALLELGAEAPGLMGAVTVAVSEAATSPPCVDEGAPEMATALREADGSGLPSAAWS